jgi:cyclophilin family peptidyl-prolyl cis-trans isomerase
MKPGSKIIDLIIIPFYGGFMNFFVKGIAACLMLVLMAGTNAQANEIAVVETTLGNIELEFLADKAPGHVKNFKDLANKGFYDGTTFHRVIPGFMIQGGDPNSKSQDKSNHGMGGPGYSIKAEFNNTPHDRGVVSMARSQDPNSAGSQFFIVVKNSHFLDNQYTVFGRVIKGLDIVDKIVKVSRDSRDNPDVRVEMKSVKIVKR